MQCPKCHAPMHTYNRNGVQIEQCSGCRGIFLDYGELEALTRLEGQWAGGPAVPADGDPWPALDVPARALTVQTAARATAKAAAEERPLDEVELSMIDACARMASLPPELTPGFAK